MNEIDEQRIIIDKLYSIVKGSCSKNVESAICTFDYMRFKDGSSSFGQEFSYIEGGELVSTVLDREMRKMIPELVEKLHKKMKRHTGGDWWKFDLEIIKDGSVRTRFYYERPEGSEFL